MSTHTPLPQPSPECRGKRKKTLSQSGLNEPQSAAPPPVVFGPEPKPKRKRLDSTLPPSAPKIKKVRPSGISLDAVYARYRAALDKHLAFHQIDARAWVAELCDLDDENLPPVGGLMAWAVIRRELDEEERVSYHCSCPDYKKSSVCVHAKVLSSKDCSKFVPFAKRDDFPAVLFHRKLATDAVPALHLFLTYAPGHSREIVSHYGRSSRDGRWACAKHTRSVECAHIKIAKEMGALRLCFGEPDGAADDKDHDTETAAARADQARRERERVEQQSMKDLEDERSVSHLPFGPPVWARLKTDNVDSAPVGVNLPEMLPIGKYPRCRCGGLPRSSSPVDTVSCIVYGANEAKPCRIQVQPCSSCRLSCGPDLREYGLFNMNNESIYSHELFDTYQSRMSTSETPLNAYCKTVHHAYSKYGSFSFVSDRTFRTAYYAFCRLQRMPDSFKCTLCGDEPEVVIFDGVTAGFAKDHLTSTLRPPTMIVDNAPTRPTVRPPSRPTSIVDARELRKQAQDAVRCLLGRKEKGRKKGNEDDEDMDGVDDDLELPAKKAKKPGRRGAAPGKSRAGPDADALFKRLCKVNKDLALIFAVHVAASERPLGEDDERLYLELLEQVLAYESVLQFAPKAAWVHLQQIATEGDKNAVEPLLPMVPAFALVARAELRIHGNITRELRGLATFVLDRATTVWSELSKHNPDDALLNESKEEDWCETGCFYGKPRVRNRPAYPHMEKDGNQERGVVTDEGVNVGCNKFYQEYGKKGLTGGLMVAWCKHSVCLGFHVIPAGEGRNDVFSALLCYWRKAPKIVVYDFACALAPYCMTREPVFFGDTLFIIDKFHGQDHTRCSPACLINGYEPWRQLLARVNSSAGECGNAGIARIRKSVSYMTQRHAIVMSHSFLAIWNRHRLRQQENDLAPASAVKTGRSALFEHRKSSKMQSASEY